MFVKYIFALIEPNIFLVLFSSENMVNYIDWFLNAKATLHSFYMLHLITLYHSFYKIGFNLLKMVLRMFASMLIGDIGL